MPSGHVCVSCVNVTGEGHGSYLATVPCFILENEEGGGDIGFKLPWNGLRLRQFKP